ncbi:OLC1v1007059C1 [Oldenlandia corymbosa var. corymbosa]|uniref:OLC1v1007059C1 n=1 Tax=Oldenlandia corymbosa var. corymbosa TaxID=529605 RepID=A0AAV1DIF9_OLDCO|nr:OLC1v1007059C1 [Oldenlandia corymbosa var. corymbosa]
MEVLMSNWKDVQSIPPNYIFPPDRRPGKISFPNCKDIPIIDLRKIDGHDDRSETIQQIIKACRHFGFFQVIHHGISESLMEEAMSVIREFFQMPGEYKSTYYSTDMNKRCRLFSSTTVYEKEPFHFWRDNLTHHCHPLEENIQSWPEKPLRYRVVVSDYSIEVRRFLLMILGLICEGLGLRPGYFEGELTKTQLFSVNYHIPCPDPSLTLGMPEHFDPNIITMVHQLAIPGLQIFKDGEWLGVKTLPNAVFVIPGLQLKVISNDLFKSPLHRVIPHATETRTTISSFLVPSTDVLIEPAEVALGNPPVYKAFTYKEFFAANSGKGWGVVLESFRQQIPE